jgi:hypothetical protein
MAQYVVKITGSSRLLRDYAQPGATVAIPMSFSAPNRPRAMLDRPSADDESVKRGNAACG